MHETKQLYVDISDQAEPLAQSVSKVKEREKILPKKWMPFQISYKTISQNIKRIIVR